MKCLTGLIVPALLLFVGCGPAPSEKLYPVKGVVTLDGAPLPAGVVTLHPLAGTATQARIISGLIGADGGYELKTDDAPGAPQGEYQITVFASIATDSTKPPVSLAPDRYTDPSKSSLKFTVSQSPPAGAYDLKLTP